MVEWDNPEKVIDLTSALLFDVNTYQTSPTTEEYQPLSKNPHYRRHAEEQEMNCLIEKLSSSTSCPLQLEERHDDYYLHLDSCDIDGFIATLESENENPLDW